MTCSRKRHARRRCGAAALVWFGAIAGFASALAQRADAKGTVFLQDPRRPGIITASSSETFLSSLGVVTHADQGFDAGAYVGPLRYLGMSNVREGVRAIAGCIMLHQQVGIRVDLVGGGVDALTTAGHKLAAADALLSIEGPNEPNNFKIIYNGKEGGGTSSWAPVAEYQRDLYKAVKSDSILGRYPVFSVSEGGAEADNVGLQFLTIPKAAGTLFPDDTRYADYANTHNYVIGNAGRYEDNQAWHAADPTLRSYWDGLSGEFGTTWKAGFKGYPDVKLQTLPRVTTETGWDSVTNPGGERVQGIVLVNTYLAQFKRGWRYTFIYNLRDGEGGNANQGLFHLDWSPKLAATYIHNLTTVLAGGKSIPSVKKLDYTITAQTDTVHDLVLQKDSNRFSLVIWGEQVSDSRDIIVDFGRRVASVKIYDVTTGTTPIRTLPNVVDVPLTISDHALVLEVEL
jgi:hypothetical protein